MLSQFRIRRTFLACFQVSALLTATTLWPVSAQAPTDVRVALVIGNAAYAGSLALANPANDAAAMSASLRGLGFTVIEAKNATRAEMEDAIRKLFTALKGKQGVGMLYYAGHGLQLDWKNYMVPVDAKLQSAKDVQGQTVDVGDVLDALKGAGSRMNVVVLDACRDNPFADKSAKGLAPVDAPAGTFLAYATAPGSVAEDGSGTNGLYTKHLLAELQKPVSIENVFKRVRLNVRRESAGRQIPWESTSLEDDFSFAANKPVVGVTRGAQRDADFIEQKAAWEKIKESTNVDDFYEFLARYPSGLISEIAQLKLEKLNPVNKNFTLPTNNPNAEQYQLLRKFSVGDTWKSKYTIYQGDRTKIWKEFEITYVVEKPVGDNLLVKGSVNIFMVPPRYDTITPEGAYISRKQTLTIDVEYNPPAVQLPADRLQVGFKSTARVEFKSSSGKAEFADFDMRISKKEKIKVPLGEFDSFLVERLESGKGGLITTTERFNTRSWYRVDLRIPLKTETTLDKLFTVEELISVTLAAK